MSEEKKQQEVQKIMNDQAEKTMEEIEEDMNLGELVGSNKNGYTTVEGMDPETRKRYLVQQKLLEHLEDTRGNRKLEEIVDVEKVADGKVHVTFKIEADGIFEEVDTEES